MQYERISLYKVIYIWVYTKINIYVFKWLMYNKRIYLYKVIYICINIYISFKIDRYIDRKIYNGRRGDWLNYLLPRVETFEFQSKTKFWSKTLSGSLLAAWELAINQKAYMSLLTQLLTMTKTQKFPL